MWNVVERQTQAERNLNEIVAHSNKPNNEVNKARTKIKIMNSILNMEYEGVFTYRVVCEVRVTIIAVVPEIN